METPPLPSLHIRPCTPADLNTLLRIGRNAFWQTFSGTNHIDDMHAGITPSGHFFIVCLTLIAKQSRSLNFLIV